MTDIVARAFYEAPKLENWDRLCKWLRVHGKNVKDVTEVIAAAQRAEQVGEDFPSDNLEELQDLIRMYRNYDPVTDTVVPEGAHGKIPKEWQERTR